MKFAILHEMLVKLGGAEKVVEIFWKIFPEADFFTLIYDEKKVGKIFPKQKINSQVFKLKTQKVYNLFKKQRLCLNYMSKSVEQLNFSDYDLVICSSSSFAHGAITKVETKFVVYYHSPSRYLWDWTNEYKHDIGFDKGFKGYFLNKLFLKLRMWDYIASNRNDIRIANSKNVQTRIQKYYNKKSILLYPPVDIKRFGKNLSNNKKKLKLSIKDYYIIISTLTEFKRIDIAINGFNQLENINLVIVGEGNYRKELEKMVNLNNIQFVGAKYDDELVSLIQNSMGLIFPGEEDFGIVPIEVMAAGKSVFAYNGGGLKETVIAGKTGDFFNDKDGGDFVFELKKYHKNNLEGKYIEENCRKQAEKFSEDNFRRELLKIIGKI